MQHAAQTRSTYTLPLHRVGGGRTARFTVVKRSAAKADAAVQSDLLRQPTTADLEHLHGKEIPVNTYNSKKPFVGKVGTRRGCAVIRFGGGAPTRARDATRAPRSTACCCCRRLLPAAVAFGAQPKTATTTTTTSISSSPSP